jgi:hypothetical protein
MTKVATSVMRLNRLGATNAMVSRLGLFGFSYVSALWP